MRVCRFLELGGLWLLALVTFLVTVLVPHLVPVPLLLIVLVHKAHSRGAVWKSKIVHRVPKHLSVKEATSVTSPSTPIPPDATRRAHNSVYFHSPHPKAPRNEGPFTKTVYKGTPERPNCPQCRQWVYNAHFASVSILPVSMFVIEAFVCALFTCTLVFHRIFHIRLSLQFVSH